MTFWISAILLTLVVAAWLTRALWRPSPPQDIAEESELSIYRDQLDELESDVARGLLSDNEAEASRIEVQRRLLRAADTQAKASTAGKPMRLIALALVLILGGATVGLYSYLGAPGLQDLPLKERLANAAIQMQNRPDQATGEERFGTPPPEAEQKHLDLLAQLREILVSGKGNAQGYQLYIQQNLSLGRYKEAYDAQGAYLNLLGDKATAEDYADLSEYMIFAAGGFVSLEAEDVIVKAFDTDPRNPRARYFSGLMALQNGRPDFTFRLWSVLQREGHADSYWMEDINARLPFAAQQAGQRYDPPLPGPTGEQIQDAEQMSPEDRQAMINSMVAGLAERLSEEGGPVQDWMRLIRAYGVQGRVAEADAAWKSAQEAFSDDPVALQLLREAAQEAEVAQ